MRTSTARQKARDLHQRMHTLMDLILASSALFAASAYEQKVRCGTPGCKCAQGDYRHRMRCVSFVEEGKSRTRVVPASVREQVESMTRDYRHCRDARRELQETFHQMLEACDVVSDARCEQGRKRFARYVKQAKNRSGVARRRGEA